MARIFALMAALLLAMPAAAQIAQNSASGPVAAIASSPDGTLSVGIGVNAEGRPEYSVSRRGHVVIAPSRLGFIFADAPKFERNFAVADVRHGTFDETWEQRGARAASSAIAITSCACA